jgi:hypothetical protein
MIPKRRTTKVCRFFFQMVRLLDMQWKVFTLLVVVSFLIPPLVKATPAFALSSCVTITHDLQLESTDASTNGDVSKLENFLSQQDALIYPEQKVDGYYGPAVRLAVYRWQKAYGIQATTLGNVDAKTRTALSNCKRTGITYQAKYTSASTPVRSVATLAFANNGCPVFSRTLSRGMRGADVQTLQSFLMTQSFMTPDTPTGYFGALTEQAMQKWQTSSGIISTGNASTGFGVLGPRTRAAFAKNCSVAGTTVASAAMQPTSAPAINCLNTNPVICQGGYVPGGICNLQCVIDRSPPPQWVTDMLQNNSPVQPSPPPPPPPSPTPTPTPTPTVSPPPPSPSPTPSSSQFTQSGIAANITTIVAGGSPYSVNFSGTYNLNNLCDNSQFNLGYGDESSDTFSSTCTPTQYSKTHTFPGPGVYDAYIAKITTDATGVQNFDYQAQIEITIGSNGSIQMGVVPPDTTASAAQANVASVLVGLQSVLQALSSFLNR